MIVLVDLMLLLRVLGLCMFSVLLGVMVNLLILWFIFGRLVLILLVRLMLLGSWCLLRCVMYLMMMVFVELLLR